MKLRNLSCIYILDDARILMLNKMGSRIFHEPLWVGVGGHFEKDELNDPDKCVLRELGEETGLDFEDIEGLTLKYITLRQTRQEIRQQYIYFASLYNKGAVLRPCNEGPLAWIDTQELFSLRMSLTNRACLQHYFDTGRDTRDCYTATMDMLNGEPTIHISRLKAIERDC